MMKTNPLRFLASQIESHIPEALRPWHQELQNVAQSLIDEKLSAWGLVSRAQFEARAAHLEALEARVRQLETRLKETPSPLESKEPQ